MIDQSDDQRCHEVTGQQNGDIGRKVVGLMRRPVLPARRAAINGLQEPGEQRNFVATGAAVSRSPKSCLKATPRQFGSVDCTSSFFQKIRREGWFGRLDMWMMKFVER